MPDQSLANQLRDLLGSEAEILIDPETIAEHSADKWLATAEPDVVVLARSTEEVSKVLAFANEHKIPVTPRGAGIGYVGGCIPRNGGIALSVAKMNQILEINPADGVAVVEPGVITADLQAAAREVGMAYPPDPASLKECSIGGNIATNAGGPRCLKYGVTRHYVLGLEVVLADGSVLNAGGRCHKNKTGFDLVGPFVGSEGMLGVVTKATLRLIPNAPARAMVSATFPSFPEAAAAVQTILSSGFLPAALEIADRFTLEASREHTNADLAPGAEAHIIVELDGQPNTVLEEAKSIDSILKENKALTTSLAESEEECEAIWNLRRDFSYSLRATGLTKLNEDVVVPRGRLVDLVTFGEKLQAETGIAVACFGHAGDGNIHVNLMVEDIEDPATREKADAALDQLFTQVLEWDGAITGEHGVGIAKSKWFPEAVGEVGLSTHHVLKNALDPNGILNPNKFLG